MLSVLDLITYSFLNMWHYLQNNSRLLLNRMRIEGMSKVEDLRWMGLRKIFRGLKTLTPPSLGSQFQFQFLVRIEWFPKEVMVRQYICRSDHELLRKGTVPSMTYSSLLKNLQSWDGCPCCCFSTTLCIFTPLIIHFIIMITSNLF